MAWLDDLLAQLQGGAQPPMFAPPSSASPFPDVKGPPTGEEIWAQIEAQNARDNAGADRRNVAGMTRAPIGGGPQFGDNPMSALAAAVPTTLQQPQPGADGSPFGMVPPSFALAKSMTANAPQSEPEPLPPGAIPTPRPRPVSTDVSAAARGGEAGSAPAPSGPPVAPPPAPMSIAAPPPAEPSFMSRLSDGAKGMAPALLAAGAALQGDNSIPAAMMAKREAQALQAQQGNATARLLQSKGASAPEIQAAIAGGPETLKALLGQYMGKDKFSVVQTKEVEDQYGGKRKVFQIFNANDGTFKDVPGNTAAEAKMAAGEGGGIDLTPDQKNRVQAIIEGREPYPAMSRATDAAKIRAAVHEADPAFDAVNYKARSETRTKFTKGKGADNLTAFNTAIGHLGSLDKSIDNLNNSGFPAWNKYIANPVAEQFDPKYQKGLKEFQTARTAVADELTRAFRGSGGNVHDIIQWENAINAADSPVALKAAVRAAAELLNSRIVSIGDEYNRGMGTTKDPLELLNPKAAQAFQRMIEGSKPSSAPAAPVKPGNYVWKNGALVPE
jgi:hypothetical protein